METPNADQPRWFEDLVFPHEAMLRGWLARRFPGLRDRDDLIQDAYVRLLEARRRGELSNPKAFLFATARNLAVDKVRREKIACFESLSEEQTQALPGSHDLAAEVSKNQELQILADAVDALPARCRTIFVLRKVHGLSQREISLRLGLSENTVSAQLTIGFAKCVDYVRRHTDRGRRSHEA